MKHRRLGKTGLRVSVIGIGTWQFGGEWSKTFEQSEVVEQVEKVKSEVPRGTPMVQWALAWCLRHPAVTCAIPGCKTVEQVESNAMAADLPDVGDDHPPAV
jgi:aryl-alcohol dehydrogenase-like predicted oxidoreductase